MLELNIDSTQVASAIRSCVSSTVRDVEINNYSLYVELASRKRMNVEDFITLATIANELGFVDVVILHKNSIYTVKISDFSALVNKDIDIVEFIGRIEADAYSD